MALCSLAGALVVSIVVIVVVLTVLLLQLLLRLGSVEVMVQVKVVVVVAAELAAAGAGGGGDSCGGGRGGRRVEGGNGLLVGGHVDEAGHHLQLLGRSARIVRTEYELGAKKNRVWRRLFSPFMRWSKTVGAELFISGIFSGLNGQENPKNFCYSAETLLL